MSSLWEDVKHAILDGYVYAADKAEELTQIGRAKVEVLRLNRTIARTMSEIGGRVFDLFERGAQMDIPDDESIAQAVKKIAALRTEVEKCEQDIERIRTERAQRGDRDPDDRG
jgi:hypothetical protein